MVGIDWFLVMKIYDKKKNFCNILIYICNVYSVFWLKKSDKKNWLNDVFVKFFNFLEDVRCFLFIIV